MDIDMNTHVTRSLAAVVIALFVIVGSLWAQQSTTQFSARDLHRWATGFHTITVSSAIDSDIVAQKLGKPTAQSQTATLDIPLQGTVSGIAVTGQIQLKGPRSLVRVILTDDQLNEYLLYEAYPLITPSILPQGGIASIRSGCQETCVLPDIRPKTIQIELISASLTISAIDVISAPATASSSTVVAKIRKGIQAAQEKEILATLNRQIRAAGLRWVAGKKEAFSRSGCSEPAGIRVLQRGDFRTTSQHRCFAARVPPDRLGDGARVRLASQTWSK
jgi:hypothetical protein